MRARRKPLRVKHAPPAPTELRPPLLPSVPAPSVQVAVAVAAAAAAGSSTDSPGRKEAEEKERERDRVRRAQACLADGQGGRHEGRPGNGSAHRATLYDSLCDWGELANRKDSSRVGVSLSGIRNALCLSSVQFSSVSVSVAVCSSFRCCSSSSSRFCCPILSLSLAH